MKWIVSWEHVVERGAGFYKKTSREKCERTFDDNAEACEFKRNLGRGCVNRTIRLRREVTLDDVYEELVSQRGSR